MNPENAVEQKASTAPEAIPVAERPPAGLRDYIAMARPDHWTKHSFIVPGIVFALLLRPTPGMDRLWAILFGFLSAAFIASANYVLNEWLDAEYDVYHPVKSTRPAVTRRLSGKIVAVEYVALAVVGLAVAWFISSLFFWTSVLFLLSGVAYNVPPVRTKDKTYVDVLTEAVNSPLRLTLGWAMIDATTLPPGSLILAYWMGGAYLMTIKRFAEHRAVAQLGKVEDLAMYRRSFRRYTSQSLLLASFLYAQMAAFFLAVFLVKYRIEYLLAMPLFAALFVVYLWIGLSRESAAQAPERLFKNRALLVTVTLLLIAMAVLTVVDLPFLEKLTTPHYIEVLE